MKKAINKEKLENSDADNGESLKFSDIKKRFQNYLRKEGKTKSTTASYVRDVLGYLEHSNEKFGSDVETITKEKVISYREMMIKSEYKAATLNTKINSLLSFNRMLIDEGKLDDIIVDTKENRLTEDALKNLRSQNS
jgi:site-specific recombinase XerD